MKSRVQLFAAKVEISYDWFMGEMRKRGCIEPTAIKIWKGTHEHYDDFSDNDVFLSNLRKAADVLKVRMGKLIPR